MNDLLAEHELVLLRDRLWLRGAAGLPRLAVRIGFDYTGADISQAMVDAATQRFAGNATARFVQGSQALQPTDFAIASDVFNVKLDRAEDGRRVYIRATPDSMHASTRKGFALNCLTFQSREDAHRFALCQSVRTLRSMQTQVFSHRRAATRLWAL